MAGQSKTGKAFEYAILYQAVEIMKSYSKEIEIKENSSLLIAKEHYLSSSITEQKNYSQAAKVALDSIFNSEKKIFEIDELYIYIQDDSQGKIGDVRDVVIASNKSDYELGVSAKNNHDALKHSRLSQSIDFGQEWLNSACSQDYFNEIKPIFDDLKEKKVLKILWRDLSDKNSSVYMPILRSFKTELARILDKNLVGTTEYLVKYIVGRKDFFKIIKDDKNRSTDIMLFNFEKSFNSFQKTKLPSKVLSLDFKKGSTTTVVIEFDNEWKMSFRIHNASSKVEPSLKFDIKLISYPSNIFVNTVPW